MTGYDNWKTACPPERPANPEIREFVKLAGECIGALPGRAADLREIVALACRGDDLNDNKAWKAAIDRLTFDCDQTDAMTPDERDMLADLHNQLCVARDFHNEHC